MMLMQLIVSIIILLITLNKEVFTPQNIPGKIFTEKTLIANLLLYPPH